MRRFFQAVVGIDPSGGRLSIVALRGGLGGQSVMAPPLLHEFRADREEARYAETEGVLGDFVARNGLVGAAACLVVPADKVQMARAVFPLLREKDLREAVGLELGPAAAGASAPFPRQADARAAAAREARSEAKRRIATRGPTYVALVALTRLMTLDVVLFGRIQSGPFFALLEKPR